VVLGLVLLALGAGCGDDRDSGSGGFVYEVADGADEHVVALIRDTAGRARRYYEKELGYRLQNQVVVNVVVGDSLSKPAFAAKEATFYLGNEAWEDMEDDLIEQLVAHEVFHLFQFDMGGPDAFITPGWMLEGAAEYAALHFMEAERDWDYEEWRLYYREMMSKSRLGQFVVVHDSEYALAAAGADYLLRDGGLKRLAAFYSTLRETPGYDWRPAFEQHFGASYEAVIDGFERERVR
jgi:hypothetical protein